VLSGVLPLASAQSPSSAPSTPAPLAAPAVPSVAGLGAEVDGLVVQGKRKRLDGLACNNCRFNNSTLTYAGGEYQLKNVTFGKGPIKVVLHGAALNTVNVMRLMGNLKLPTPGGAPAGFVKPKMETVELTAPLNVTTDSMARLVS
jgi:hypothetical protein